MLKILNKFDHFQLKSEDIARQRLEKKSNMDSKILQRKSIKDQIRQLKTEINILKEKWPR